MRLVSNVDILKIPLHCYVSSVPLDIRNRKVHYISFDAPFTHSDARAKSESWLDFPFLGSSSSTWFPHGNLFETGFHQHTNPISIADKENEKMAPMSPMAPMAIFGKDSVKMDHDPDMFSDVAETFGEMPRAFGNFPSMFGVTSFPFQGPPDTSKISDPFKHMAKMFENMPTTAGEWMNVFGKHGKTMGFSHSSSTSSVLNTVSEGGRKPKTRGFSMNQVIDRQMEQEDDKKPKEKVKVREKFVKIGDDDAIKRSIKGKDTMVR